MTFANGLPKAGCHALKKAIELLGEPSEVRHEPWSPYVIQADIVGAAKRITTIRHPRNALISMCKWMGRPVTTGTLILMTRVYGEQPYSLAVYYRKFLKWMTETAPSTLCVRYEDLVRDDQTMRQIAAFIGRPYFDDAFNYLPGLTYSWNAEHSDWPDVWSGELDRVWQQTGAAELQAELGY